MAPDAGRSTGSGHAIANVLGAGIQLNSDCLESARGLVAYIMAPARRPGTSSPSLTPTDGAAQPEAWPSSSSFKFTATLQT